jgi:hypothetical protein
MSEPVINAQAELAAGCDDTLQPAACNEHGLDASTACPTKRATCGLASDDITPPKTYVERRTPQPATIFCENTTQDSGPRSPVRALNASWVTWFT